MTSLQLYYRSTPVARLDDVHEDQDNWYGEFTFTIRPEDGDTQRRVVEFVDFCKEWHSRLETENDPDADEFDAYPDMIEPGAWSTVDDHGRRRLIDWAPTVDTTDGNGERPPFKPTFTVTADEADMYQDSVTWRYWDGTQPSPYLKLFYRSLLVAWIDNYKEHQKTWIGDFTLIIQPKHGGLQRRVVEFGDFCKQWQARQGTPDALGGDAFDAFPDMLGPAVWSTVDAGGRRRDLADAPFVDMADEDGEQPPFVKGAIVVDDASRYSDGVTWRYLNEVSSVIESRTVQVSDFGGDHQVSSLEELRTVLAARFGENSNSYWISEGPDTHPKLSLLVKDELAWAIYFPEDGHPGFVPVGDVPGLDPDGDTIFYFQSLTEKEHMTNYQVISLADGMTVAEEFFRDDRLPTCIEWDEL